MRRREIILPGRPGFAQGLRLRQNYAAQVDPAHARRQKNPFVCGALSSMLEAGPSNISHDSIAQRLMFLPPWVG